MSPLSPPKNGRGKPEPRERQKSSLTQSKREPITCFIRSNVAACVHIVRTILRAMLCERVRKQTICHVCGFRCCCCSEAFVSLCPSTTPLTSCSITRLVKRKTSIPQTQSRKRGPLCYQTSWQKRIR